MRNKVIWSFLSLAALAVGGLAAGCDSDAKIARSAEGESCTKTSDCEDNLRCKAAVCVSSGTDVNNNEGGEGNGASGSPSVGPAPQTLGGPGESCGKRADCLEGLACLSGRCTAEGGGEGGAPSGPTLGGLGETCGLTTDCQKGLQCLPDDGVRFEALGATGVCQRTDNGLEPTGKVCGAECVTADDCCELPIQVHIANISAPTYGTGVNSCAELATVLDGVNCDAAVLTTQNAARCFAMEAYCKCAKNTWTCAEGGSCVYNAACDKNYATPGGCPTYSRAGRLLTATCDAAGSGKCELPAATATCKADADCDKGELVADGGGEACTAGECTCYKETGMCYRKCAEPLDCAAGSTCDTKTHVCVQNAQCTSDAYCVTAYNDIHYKCDGGRCQPSCENDRDCNYGELTYPGNTRVCDADHHCVAVGCSNDDECLGGLGNVRLFCAAPAGTSATPGVSSAITD